MYKNIEHPFRRVNCQHDNGICLYYLTIYLFAITATEWIKHIILLSEDVESNPGPDSVEGSTDSVSSSSFSSFETLTNHLK